MDTIETVVLIIHTFIAVLLIVLVLLQRGKGADAGAAFGAGASGTVFGARGSSNFFSRATAILATAFFASSLALAYMSSQHTDAPGSLLESEPAVEQDETMPETSTETEEVPEIPVLPDTEEPARKDTETPPGDAELPALKPEEPADDEKP